MGPVRMEPLVVAKSPFEATVIAARLGADGIVTEQRGATSAYPVALGGVRIYVRDADLALARALLLADEVESAFASTALDLEAGFDPYGVAIGGPPPWYRRRWVRAVAIMLLAAGAGSRVV